MNEHQPNPWSPSPSPRGEPGTGKPARRHARTAIKVRQRHTWWSGAQDALQPLPTWAWVLSAVLALAGCFSANPVLTPCCVLMVPILATLLWLKGEPPVLLFATAMQWVQASAAVFYTNLQGLSLRDVREAGVGGTDFIQATWLSLLGVLVLAVGMRLALIRRTVATGAQAERESRFLDPGRIFVLYLFTFIVLALVGKAAAIIPGLRQAGLATTTLKWVVLFVFAYAVLTQRRGYGLLAIAVGVELLTGVLGYFSSFKGILFILLVALPSATHFFRGFRLAEFGLLAVLVLVLGIIWTGIKQDYREFLNQGTGQQIVLVPVDQRVEKLVELTGRLNESKIQNAWEDLILRASYVKFFSLCLQNVPANLPHEHGELWFGAIKHVLMPRLFFPNKPVINDSERTSHYSGMPVAGAEQGTSISIGYIAESYIDFGRVGMFVPILLLGVFYGLIYRYFVDGQPIKVLGFGMATAILIFGAYTIETSNIKLIGGNLTNVIVMALFARFAGRKTWQMMTVYRRQRSSRYPRSRRGRRQAQIANEQPTPEIDSPHG